MSIRGQERGQQEVLASTNPSSVGGTHKIGFLIHMAVIQDQKPTLELAWRPSSENVINKNLIFPLTWGPA